MTHPQQPDDRYWDNLTMQRQQQHVPSPPIFAIGDVVRLRSGGPAMTVAGEQGERGYPCAWHLADRQSVGAYFRAPTLTLVAAPQASEPEPGDIVVTEVMEDAGLDAWHATRGTGVRNSVKIIYRAMQGAQPHKTRMSRRGDHAGY